MYFGKLSHQLRRGGQYFGKQANKAIHTGKQVTNFLGKQVDGLHRDYRHAKHYTTAHSGQFNPIVKQLFNIAEQTPLGKGINETRRDIKGFLGDVDYGLDVADRGINPSKKLDRFMKT